jgi:hypothetical protein
LIKWKISVRIPDSLSQLEKHEKDLHYFFYMDYQNSNDHAADESMFKLEKSVRTVSIKELCANYSSVRYEGLVLFFAGAYNYQIKEARKEVMRALFYDARNYFFTNFRLYLDLLS